MGSSVRCADRNGIQLFLGVKGIPVDNEHPANDWQCPFCGTLVRRGFTICTGCRAELIYGATRSEWQTAAIGGVLLGFSLSLLLLVFLPEWLGFVMGWGLGFYAVLPAGLATAAIAYAAAHAKDMQRRQQPPRFFPREH